MRCVSHNVAAFGSVLAAAFPKATFAFASALFGALRSRIKVMESMDVEAEFQVILQKEGKDVQEITFTGPGTTGPELCAMNMVDLEKKFGAGNPIVDDLLKFRRKAVDSRYR